MWSINSKNAAKCRIERLSLAAEMDSSTKCPSARSGRIKVESSLSAGAHPRSEGTRDILKSSCHCFRGQEAQNHSTAPLLLSLIEDSSNYTREVFCACLAARVTLCSPNELLKARQTSGCSLQLCSQFLVVSWKEIAYIRLLAAPTSAFVHLSLLGRMSFESHKQEDLM